MSNVVNIFAKNGVPSTNAWRGVSNSVELPRQSKAPAASRIAFKKMQESLSPNVAEFAREERGGGTLWMLTWLMLFIGLGGIAIDTTNAQRMHTMLQWSADSAALAAIQDLDDPAKAKSVALQVTEMNMPASFNGSALDVERNTDFQIGYWDHDARTFTVGSAEEPNAVGVLLRRDGLNGNNVPTTFLHITGLKKWDLARPAVAATFIPDCFKSEFGNSIVANGESHARSNNVIQDTCWHAVGGIKMENNNVFITATNPETGEPDITNQVSMTNWEEQLDVPADDLDKNPGLEDVVASNSYLRAKLPAQVRRNIATILNEVYEGEAVDMDLRDDLIPEYITNPSAINVITQADIQGRTVDFSDPSMRRRIHHIVGPCNKINVTASEVSVDYIDENGLPATTVDKVIRDQVIISDCDINIASGTKLWNVVLGSRADLKPHQSSINVGQGVHLGRDDNCTLGDGGQMWATSSIHMPSQVEIYGFQIVAEGDVEIAAQVYGIEGIAVEAGGDINFTSLAAFGGGGCTGGVDSIITAEWYRLVQ